MAHIASHIEPLILEIKRALVGRGLCAHRTEGLAISAAVKSKVVNGFMAAGIVTPAAVLVKHVV
jgi:hypothetical protein